MRSLAIQTGTSNTTNFVCTKRMCIVSSLNNLVTLSLLFVAVFFSAKTYCCLACWHIFLKLLRTVYGSNLRNCINVS